MARCMMIPAEVPTREEPNSCLPVRSEQADVRHDLEVGVLALAQCVPRKCDGWCKLTNWERVV